MQRSLDMPDVFCARILDVIPGWKKLRISRKIFYGLIVGLICAVLLFGFNTVNIINFSTMINQIDEVKERQLFFERFNREMINFQTHISYINSNIQNGSPLQPEHENHILSIKTDLEPKLEKAIPIVKTYVPVKETELTETFNELFKAVDQWAANKTSSNLGYINGVFYNAQTVLDYVITFSTKQIKENIEQIERQKASSIQLGIVLNLILIFIFLIMMFPLLSEIRLTFTPLLNASETALLGANESLTYATSINQSIKQLSEVLNQMTINISAVSNNAYESSNLSSNIIYAVKIAANLVGDLSHKASDTVNSLTLFQQELKAKINQIKEMTHGIGSALQVVTSNTDIAEKLNDELSLLEVRTREISEVLVMMTGITEETNLLSFNANIEAARAGKFGKGFHVVGERIRELSKQTQNMTTQIHETVNGIQKVSLAINKSLKCVIESVRKSARQVSQITSELPKIEKVFQSIYDSNEAIITMANIQLASTNQIHYQSTQIANSVENIFVQTESVSTSMQELAASSEEINAQLETISGMVDDTHQVIKKQVTLADIAKKTTEQI